MKKKIINFLKLFKPLTVEYIFKPFNRIYRYSSKNSVLKNLIKTNIPISQIVDVGVSTSTDELINCFPKKEHLLFEPVFKNHKYIAKNYKKIKHKLFKVALSNEKKIAYCNEYSNWSNGISTHASISLNPVKVDGKKFIKCEKLKVDILDSYEEIIKKNFLLKIDVDGTDLEVLNGSKKVIKNASIVIIEATWSGLAERAKFVEDQGFVLYDIADKCFYGDALWQCDLVFVRKDFNKLVRKDINKFNYFLWHEL